MSSNEKKYTNDPAYKHIKNSRSEYVKAYTNWKENLNPEEKEFYNSHPLPFLASKAEDYSLFLKRYEKSKKEPSVTIPSSQKMKASFNKNLKNKNTCPECGSSVNPDEKFCGECGFNLENLVSKENNMEVKKEQNSRKEETVPLVKVKNKKEDKPLKIKTKKTSLICSECGFPLNEREDVFCPECGCKIIYPTDEVNTKSIEIKNSTKGNEYIKVTETEDSIQEESLVSENEDSIQEESLVSNKEMKEKPKSQNNLPIDILIDLKSFFEDKLINEIEYNQLRKLALKIATDPKSKGDLSKIKSISREKLSELRNLFNEQLIDKDEYDDLRKNLIEIE